ncbi:MAG: CCA tRNA nucleotidyltransferase, partial [Bacteroidaceae bacterium]|nr:CCA tRNA nucleotidyltransferase [Bacteroidaceae bacterium]
MNDAEKGQLKQEIRRLIAGTEFEGHVFMVGGAVRDELMGLPVKDIDLCVDLPDGGIRLARFITQEQGTYRKNIHPTLFPSYGIAKFHLASAPETEIECVQTRKERYQFRDSRNPVTEFASLAEDCLRRDLTINALYQDLSTGRIVDISGHGLHDLEHRIIRTPREPFVTFDEDALRELRCIRFAARFGWEIEPDTLRGITDNAERIRIITQDRITDEFSRMLLGPRPDYAFTLLKDTGLLAHILPEWLPTLTAPYGTCTCWDYLLRTVNDSEPQLASRLTAFTQQLEVEERTAFLRRMNYPVEVQKSVQRLSRHIQAFNKCHHGKPLTDAALRRLQYEWNGEASSVLHLLSVIHQHSKDGHP